MLGGKFLPSHLKELCWKEWLDFCIYNMIQWVEIFSEGIFKFSIRRWFSRNFSSIFVWKQKKSNFSLSHIFSTFGFWYFGHFSFVIFFLFFSVLPIVPCKKVNIDYVIFLYFRNFVDKSDQKPKTNNGMNDT